MLLLLLAPGARAQDPAEFPREKVEAVLSVALGAVLERHIEREAPARLALWSLRGLEVLEPLLRPELRGGDTLVLAAGSPEQALASRALPALPPAAAPEAAAPPLAALLAAMFEAAWRASPQLRRAGPERMLRSAFEELFDRLDPYSRYLTPEEARAARLQRVGQADLGLRLGAGRGGRGVVVAALSPDGAAAGAGVRLGDRVLAVDGVPVSPRDLGFAATLLEGPADTEVELRVERDGRRRAVLLRRLLAPPASVRSEARDGVLWLRVAAFAGSTDGQVADALLAGLAPAGAATRGVVLDLRGNRGGLLSEAVAVASAFLPGGTVARTTGRHSDAARVWEASGPDLARGLPVVVLVDGRSASAAEIVAAALGGRGRAVVVGSATTGKGLIQAVVPLPNGGELLVTWSQVLGPGGWPIQGVGVLPAVCTSFGAEALAEELARLRRGEAPGGAGAVRLRALRPPPPSLPVAEIAALRATCPSAEGRDAADGAAAQTLLDAPEAYAAALLP
jgi:carboxyl-terminal processing protease